MPRCPVRLLTLSACALLVAAAPAVAQSSTADKGRKKLPKLFAEAVSAASKATVRVLADGKPVALGTVVTSDGYVLTKRSELRGELVVVIQDGTEDGARYPATLLAADIGKQNPDEGKEPTPESDLALLKIEATGLQPVAFADAKAVAGNWVATVGPKAEPIAVGVVSSAARKLYGEQGYPENANRGFLGVTLALKPADDGGAIVGTVNAKGAGANAGIKPRDVILELAGKAVSDRRELMATLEGYTPGDSVTVKVRRGEEELSLRVKLGGKGDFDRGTFQNTMGGSLSGRRTGFPAVIQHDTVLRPSDCGGPLVDLDGKVVGINIARAGRVETWALPTEVVKSVLKELKDAKKTSAVKRS